MQATIKKTGEKVEVYKLTAPVDGKNYTEHFPDMKLTDLDKKRRLFSEDELIIPNH